MVRQAARAFAEMTVELAAVLVAGLRAAARGSALAGEAGFAVAEAGSRPLARKSGRVRPEMR